MAFWISGTVFKLFPCILLTVLVSLLTRILKEVRENRQRLLLGNRGFAGGAYINADHSSACATQIQAEYTTVGAEASGALQLTPNLSGTILAPVLPGPDERNCSIGNGQPQKTPKRPSQIPHQIIVTVPSHSEDDHRGPPQTPLQSQQPSPTSSCMLQPTVTQSLIAPSSVKCVSIPHFFLSVLNLFEF